VKPDERKAKIAELKQELKHWTRERDRALRNRWMKEYKYAQWEREQCVRYMIELEQEK
jgi:hypothetical protein